MLVADGMGKVHKYVKKKMLADTKGMIENAQTYKACFLQQRLEHMCLCLSSLCAL